METEVMIIFRFNGAALTLMLDNGVSFEDFKIKLASIGVPDKIVNGDMISKTDRHDECVLRCQDHWRMLMFLVRTSGCTVVTITSVHFVEANLIGGNQGTSLQVQCSLGPGTNWLIPRNSQNEVELPLVDIVAPHIDIPTTEPKLLLTSPWRYYITGEGQVFRGGVKEFRVKLSKFMVETGYKFNFVRNSDKQVMARCFHAETHGCKWYISATCSKNTKWCTIRTYVPEHCCPMDVRSKKTLSAKIIGALIVGKVRNDPNIKAVKIVELFHEEYGLNIGYMQAYRGKEQAQNFIYGCHDDSYHELKWYVRKLLQLNPGSVVEFVEGPVTNNETGLTKNRFLRTFIAFKATIAGFEHCRPMLFLDGTHLSGRYGGVILSATAKDGDNGLFPVAFAVVESETKDNWRWFLLNLLTTFSEGRKVIFVSDRFQGLVQLFLQEFKDYENFYCLEHLKRNLRDRLKSRALNPGEKEDIVALFCEAATAPTINIFDAKIEDFKLLGGAAAAKFLDDLPLKKWAFSHAPCARFGEMTSNAVESYNNWIKDARELPITQCVDTIRTQTMEQLYRRRTFAETWTKGLCVHKQKEWNDFIQLSRSWTVRRASEHIFEFLLEPTIVVRLDERRCDCFGWQFHGYPCVHGVAAIHRSGHELSEHIDHYYFDAAYKAAYEGTIIPIPTILKLTDVVEKWPQVFPPIKVRKHGRPKKKRYLSVGEHGRKFKRPYTCKTCGKNGHGAGTCRNAIR